MITDACQYDKIPGCINSAPGLWELLTGRWDDRVPPRPVISARGSGGQLGGVPEVSPRPGSHRHRHYTGPCCGNRHIPRARQRSPSRENRPVTLMGSYRMYHIPRHCEVKGSPERLLMAPHWPAVRNTGYVDPLSTPGDWAHRC